MSRFTSVLAVATGLLVASCSVQIPDATYVCGPTEGCPSGFVCSDGLCRREAVDAGPLGDMDVDGGNDDGGNCQTEVCNGADDDCDGIVDDGVMDVFDSEDVASTSGAFWSRFLAVEGGGFVAVAAIPDGAAGNSAIVATRYEGNGDVAVASVELARSSSNHFEAIVFESHLYIVRDAATSEDLILDQFAIATLTRVGMEYTVTAAHQSDFYDIVSQETVFGDRVAVVFRGEDGIASVQSVAVPSLAFDAQRVIHTPTVDDLPFTFANIVSAPCGTGLYVQLARFVNDPAIRIVPLDATGLVIGDAHDILPTSPDVLYAISRPLLVGGSCSEAPTELIVSWVEADGFPSAEDHTTLHVDTLGVTHSLTPPLRTLTRTGGTHFDPQHFINPAAAFTIHWPVTLTRFDDGRLFVGLSCFVQTTSNSALDVYELQPGFTERTRHETNAQPATALQLDFSSPVSSPATFVLGGARWTSDGPAAYFRLGCAE